ncbi:hypothetical protein KVR01_008886 [Diaporthe batatas]|uniref:uncharacterized protein n=1 Tax=Diaporthe batatas TaxID=748121 RepID=UPI001D046A2A|nr:uncharacterized protein KVR01_008886 [Diaporthe batatas]KAG8160622.1 hypothetical protein KVR01_008886 [Diaporthe batatas]
MRGCIRLHRSLGLAGLDLSRPTAQFYSTKRASADAKPASRKRTPPREASGKPYAKSTKALRGSRLDRVPDDNELGYDQWAWSEVNLDDKTIQTPAGNLPISPLLDPAWREARQRKKTKATPDKKSHNRFQRQLRQNPYAQLLATPVRLCSATRTHLPKAMLQAFGVVRHPETNQVWWLPEGLDAPRKPSSKMPDEAEETDEPSPEVPEDGPRDRSTGTHNKNGPAGSSDKQAAYSYPMNALGRQDLIKGFSTPGNLYFSGHKRIAGMPSAPPQAKSAVWRVDMDGVILDQRRRQIMEDLLHLCTLCEENGRRYIIRITDAKYSATYVHRAAFLWLGEDTASGSQQNDQGLDGKADKAEVDPEQYATLDIDGDPTTTRPVYNLPRLLGPANVARLRTESSLLRDGSLFLLRSQRSGPVNKKLWSLQGYMATYS